MLIKGPRPEHLRLLNAVGALDRLAHENHIFTDLGAAVSHAQVHAQRRLSSPTQSDDLDADRELCTVPRTLIRWALRGSNPRPPACKRP